MSAHKINHPIFGPGFECPPPMTFAPRPPVRVNVLQLIDQAVRTIAPLSKASGDGNDQLAGHLRYEAKSAIEDLIAEAQYVVDNPSERNLADLRAALARIERVS